MANICCPFCERMFEIPELQEVEDTEQEKRYCRQLVADTNSQRTIECQQRVERIFREIEKCLFFDRGWRGRHAHYELEREDWQGLKKQEGVK